MGKMVAANTAAQKFNWGREKREYGGTTLISSNRQ